MAGMELAELEVNQRDSLQYYIELIQEQGASAALSEVTRRVLGAVAVSCEDVMTVGCFIRMRTTEEEIPHPDDAPHAVGIKQRVAQHRAILEAHGLKGIDMDAEFRANDRAMELLDAGVPISKVIESINS